MNLNTVSIKLILLTLALPSCHMKKEAAVDQLFLPYADRDVPGAAVAVIKNGTPIFSKAYGMANLEENEPMTTGHNLRLASVTKQFTAMSIMMLVERNLLSYNSALRFIFPSFPEYGNRITIRHLLQHTSGLVDYESLIPDTATIQVLDQDVLTLMMLQNSTYFTPGSEYRYSNTGYALLALVVEKLSGVSFAEFLKENIFTPLTMTNTVAYENGKSAVANRAYGYAATDSGFVFRDQSLTSAVLGDGGIYSSVEDLYKWDQALYTEKLITFETLTQAFTPAVLEQGQPAGYGFGWRIDEYRGHQRVHHTGSTCGFATIIQRYPEAKFTVIILTNRSEPELTDIANRLTDLLIGS